MMESDAYFFELNAADRALLMALRRKLKADSGHEIRTALRSLLSSAGTARRGAEINRKSGLDRRGRLLVLPLRSVSVGKENTCSNSALAETGQQPAL